MSDELTAGSGTAAPGRCVEAIADIGAPTAVQIAERDIAFARANRTGPVQVGSRGGDPALAEVTGPPATSPDEMEG